jgi:hypothetical protein
MTEETSNFGRPDALKTIVLGGLTVGVLDLIDAVTFFGLYYAVPPMRIFQSIAAGVYGRDASREGGWSTAIQGILLHFVIATLIATVFYIGTRFIPILYKKPVISGPIYGVICYFVMQLVVVPLSNAPSSAITINPAFWNGIIGHALLVGLPVALIAAWSASSRQANVTPRTVA